jgi:hypothetical protein
MPKMKETAIVKAILATLKLAGYWAFRINSGSIVLPGEGTHARRVIRGAEPGTPDIFVVLRGGLFGVLEVKTLIGKLRPSQIEWLAKAESYGVKTAIVRSAGEALGVVKQWGPA